MKAKEKEVLYSFFTHVLDSISGFRSKDHSPTFTDDKPVIHKPSSSIKPALSTAKSFSSQNKAPLSSTNTLPERDDLIIQHSYTSYSSMEELTKAVSLCEGCDLCSTRHSTVAGEGPKETFGILTPPPIMVIGEAPGVDEDIQGRPFVGASGKLLDKMLKAINLYRTKNCYITNVVKCRPPGNRNPSREEILACSHFLKEQIRLLSPKMILILGNVALKSMLNTERGITYLHGKLYFYEDKIPTIATYHPSALLRREELKRDAWEDLKFFNKYFCSLSPKINILAD